MSVPLAREATPDPDPHLKVGTQQGASQKGLRQLELSGSEVIKLCHIAELTSSWCSVSDLTWCMSKMLTLNFNLGEGHIPVA